MQIIVVSFPYHVRPKKAIGQAVLKIKSAFYTNACIYRPQKPHTCRHIDRTYLDPV